MTKILGIDADTVRVAYCIGEKDETGKFVVEKVATIKRRISERSANFYPFYAVELRALLKNHMEQGGVVYLEDIFCKNKKGFCSLAKVQGEICYEAGAVLGLQSTIRSVMPRSWQSYLGHNLKVPFRYPLDTKRASALCAMQIAGYIPESSHECDAICIAYFGSEVYTDASTAKKQVDKEKNGVSRKRKVHKRRRVRPVV